MANGLTLWMAAIAITTQVALPDESAPEALVFDLIRAREPVLTLDEAYALRELQVSGIVSGDFDGDCTADLAVAVELMDDRGQRFLWLFSGQDAAFMREIDGGTWSDTEAAFGAEIAPAGDVDADGCDDILIGLGHPMGAVSPVENQARVYSGRTGALLVEEQSERECNDGFGASVCGLGDLDGDGRDDWCLAVPSGDCAGLPRVVVYSGTSHRVLREMSLPAWNPQVEFDMELAPAGDVDSDGRCDLWVAASTYVACFSGATGSLLSFHSGSRARFLAETGPLSRAGFDAWPEGVSVSVRGEYPYRQIVIRALRMPARARRWRF